MPILSVGKRRGFTLLELLVVMAIIGMTAALVIPRISSAEVTLLKAQVREAVAVLKYARRSAIVEGKQKIAIFYKGSTMGRWDNRNAPEKGDAHIFIFYHEGGSNGGEIILNQLNYKAKITVNPITGKVDSEFLYE